MSSLGELAQANLEIKFGKSIPGYLILCAAQQLLGLRIKLRKNPFSRKIPTKNSVSLSLEKERVLACRQPGLGSCRHLLCIMPRTNDVCASSQRAVVKETRESRSLKRGRCKLGVEGRVRGETRCSTRQSCRVCRALTGQVPQVPLMAMMKHPAKSN